MPIYEITPDKIEKIPETTFEAAGLRERDLQRLLRQQIEVIAPDTLVIAEEFGEWEDSRRRIDLLGLDKDANLVVIELKRTEDGGHMELQAIRYAAMVSTMTFEKAVDIYRGYLKDSGSDAEAQGAILDFLGWDEPDEDNFAQDVRIVLVSAEFGKELTTAVMWLNERDLDIRCVRIKPYADNGRVLIDVRQVVPLPEATEYQVQIREKKQRERVARQYSRDYTRYDVVADGVKQTNLPKGRTMQAVVKHMCAAGVMPESIAEVVKSRQKFMFRMVEGKVTGADLVAELKRQEQSGGPRFDPKRYFCRDDDLIFFNDCTYAMCNQCGPETYGEIQKMIQAFPDKNVTCVPSGTEE